MFKIEHEYIYIYILYYIYIYISLQHFVYSINWCTLWYNYVFVWKLCFWTTTPWQFWLDRESRLYCTTANYSELSFVIPNRIILSSKGSSPPCDSFQEQFIPPHFGHVHPFTEQKADWIFLLFYSTRSLSCCCIAPVEDTTLMAHHCLSSRDW